MDHGYGETGGETAQRLTNDDFRKLLQTPRAGGNNSGGSSRTPSFGSGRGGNSSHKKHGFAKPEDKKSKRIVHPRVKSEEEEIMAELAKKYRDRAKERREGSSTDSSAPDALSTLGAYRAVAPDIKTTMDAAERRKQMIQESKYLGGDMEHTHLVKGLDYALLQKVRSELEMQEQEKEDEMEQVADEPKKDEKSTKKDVEDEIQFKTIIGKNVYRAVFKSAPPQRNEHFLPGRMAYLIELEDEFAEAEIPTTVLRSKADCPGVESQATLSTNDIVINKLTQILSYLRHGGKQAKKLKKAKENKEQIEQKPVPKKSGTEDSIYGNIGDYRPSESRYDSRSRYHEREKADDKRTYFDEKKERKERDRYREYEKEKSDVMAEAERTLKTLLKPGTAKKQEESNALANKLSSQPEGYAECYPGFDEMQDAIEDSDEDVDYTKMDLGSKKGLVGRWDFDTAEEYGEYMNKKEALPKAAFQYGLKMADGRKTRRLGVKTEKTEKAELDREWQKIQSIIHKRKSGPSGGSSEGAPEKMPRR